ncbi:MAG: hypothetical protein V1684_02995 [bacterium]
MAIALSLPAGSFKSKNKTNSFMAKIRAKTVLIGLAAACLFLSLLILYFAQINVLVAKGYQINEFKQDLARLQEKNRQLELQATTLQSQQILAKKIETMGLVKATQIDYFLPGGNSVAVR